MNSIVTPEIREVMEVVHYRPAVSVIMPFEPKMKLKKLMMMWTEFYKKLDIDMVDNEAFEIGRGFRKNEMEIRKSINELTTLGCDDPLFIFLKHSLYYAWYDFRFSIEKLIKSSDDLIKLKYSNYPPLGDGGKTSERSNYDKKLFQNSLEKHY